MICNCCKKTEAVFSIEHVFAGVSKNIYLCRECASKIGLDKFSDNVEISITNILKKDEKINKKEFKSSRFCPTCGQNLSDIIIKQKIACLDCFTVFEKEIKEFLHTKKTDIKYTGKIPLKYNDDFDKAMSVIKLKQKLQNAVENEEYELAAFFRDELKNLENPNG